MHQNFHKQQPKTEGRGVLEAILTDGPHRGWLGMPDYYVFTLTVSGEEYKYLSPEKLLDVQVGDTVVFRYKEIVTKKNMERRIDKRSLGIYIDPAEYNK